MVRVYHPYCLFWAMACLFMLALPLYAQPELGAPPISQEKYEGRLLTLLTDGDPRVRVQAVERVGEFPYLREQRDKIEDTLVTLLANDPVAEVRKAAAQAMGRLGVTRAVTPLATAAARDADPAVREAAAFAHRVALGALASLRTDSRPTPECLPPLTRPLLQDPDLNVRTAAALALLHWNETIPPDALLAGFQATDANIRREVALALEKHPDPRAIEPLLALLTEADTTVRAAAIAALGATKEQRAIDALPPMLADPRDEVRQAAILALANLGMTDDRLFDAVGKILHEQTLPERWAIIRLLGNLRDERAVLLLIEALHDKAGHIILMAAYELYQLADPALFPKTGSARPVKRVDGKPGDVDPEVSRLIRGERASGQSVEGPWTWSEASLNALIAALESPTASTRRAAIITLALIGVPRAVEPITRLARDTDAGIRRAAIGALCKLNPDGRVELLCGTAKDPDPTVREIVALGLRLCKAPETTALDPRALDALLALLRDEDERVCCAAIEALSEQDNPRVKEALLGLLSDPREAVPAAVVSSYRPRVTDPRAVEPLLALLKKAYQRKRDADNLGRQPLVDPQIVEDALQWIGRPAAARLRLVLTDPDADLRLTAIRLLAHMRDGRAVMPMASLLRDPDVRVRLAAVRALGELGGPNMVEPLRAALADEDEWVRREAAVSLAMLGSAEGLEQTLAMTRGYGDRMRALQALSRLRDPRAVEPLLAMLQVPGEPYIEFISEALGGAGDTRAVEPLIAVLGDTNYSHKLSIITALGRLRDARAVEPLLPLLQDGHYAVKTLDALAEIRDPRAIEPIMMAYRQPPDKEGGFPRLALDLDGRPEVIRQACIRALFTIGLPALEKAIALLADPRPEARLAAADVLGEMPDARALPALLPLLRDADGQARLLAARALGRIGDDRAHEPLLPLLTDADPAVQRQAAIALAFLGDTRAAPLLAREILTGTPTDDYRQLWDVVNALANVSEGCDGAALVTALLEQARTGARSMYQVPEVARAVKGQAFEPLRRALADAQLRVRLVAISGLRNTGDPRAADVLVPLLGDADPQIRGLALHALGSLKDTRALETALQWLNGPEPSRSAALSALRLLRDPRAVEPSIAILRDGSAQERSSAISTLENIDDPRARDALLHAMQADDVDGDTFRRCALALGWLGEQRAAPLLREALFNGRRDDAFYEIPRALGLLRDREAVPLLLDLLKQSDARAKDLAFALGRCGDPAAVEPLIRLLDANRPETVAVAARALGQLKDPRAVEPLIALLRKPALSDQASDNSKPRAEAAWALGAIGDPRAIAPLTAALEWGSLPDRQATAEALKQLTTDIVRGKENE